jgi:hypothetical protein
VPRNAQAEIRRPLVARRGGLVSIPRQSRGLLLEPGGRSKRPAHTTPRPAARLCPIRREVARHLRLHFE